MLRSFVQSLVVFLSISLPFSALASEKSTYVNEEYGFTLRHPSSLMLKSFGEGYFDLLKGGKILLRASIEDDTFKIFIQEIKPETDVFRRFAREMQNDL